MNRNEFLEALPLTRIMLKLTGATLEICTDDIDDINVMVSGADGDVKALRISVSGDQLLVEQPAVSLAKNPMTNNWLQVTIRLPLTWKGRIDGRTVSGWINVRGLSGSDLSLDTVSGLITASTLIFQTLSIRSVTGDIRINGMACEKGAFFSTSGAISMQSVSMKTCTLTSVTGNAALSLTSPFESIAATSVTGDLMIDAPIDAARAQMRSVAGHISTNGVSIAEEAEASVQFNTVSGSLDLTRTEFNP